MTSADRPAWWIVPIVAFVAAALLTVALRDGAEEPARQPSALPLARDVAARIPAPRLADVPDLPAPLAPRRRSGSTGAAPRTSVNAARPPSAPAPDDAQTAAARTPPQQTAPAQTAPAQTAPAQTAPAEPPPAPAPPTATPAPTFDDSGSSPQFDDSGSSPQPDGAGTIP